MAILLILDDRDNSSWINHLRRLLPNTSIEVYPTVRDPLAIEFIISMRPRKEQVAEFPNAKVMHSIGAGVNYIIDEGALLEGMQLARIVDPYLSSDMFEFLLAVVAEQIKNLPLYRQFQRQQKWKPISYKRFPDTHISILGLGKIGSFVAERFAQLGFRVSGWSNSKKNIQNVASYTGVEGLGACLAKADFLINILPLTATTKHILNRETLSLLPKGAFLINVGRGLHNQEQDIIELLEEDHLSGGLLDVFKKEPLATNHPFWQHPKINITPHIASLSNPESVVEIVVDNYKRFTKGEPLHHLVSLEKGY